MKRSEWLLKLALENKFAVVREDKIDVTTLSDGLDENVSISENSSVHQDDSSEIMKNSGELDLSTSNACTSSQIGKQPGNCIFKHTIKKDSASAVTSSRCDHRTNFSVLEQCTSHTEIISPNNDCNTENVTKSSLAEKKIETAVVESDILAKICTNGQNTSIEKNINQMKAPPSSHVSDLGPGSGTSEEVNYHIETFLSNNDRENKTSNISPSMIFKKVLLESNLSRNSTGIGQSTSIANTMNIIEGKSPATSLISDHKCNTVTLNGLTYYIEYLVPEDNIENQTETTFPRSISENVLVDADVIQKRSASLDQNALSVLTIQETLASEFKYGCNDDKDHVSDPNNDKNESDKEVSNNKPELEYLPLFCESYETNNQNCRSPMLPLKEELAHSVSSGSISHISDTVPDDMSYQETFSGFNSDTTVEDNKYDKDFLDFEDSGSEYLPSLRESTSSPEFDMSSEKEYYKCTKVQNTHIQNKTDFVDCKPRQSDFPITERMETDDSQPSTSEVQDQLEPINQSTSENDLKLKKFNKCKDSPFSEVATGENQKYIKKPTARERPTICPICYHDVITHFTRHLFRHHGDHKDVKIIKSLNPRSKERLSMVAALRKQGYFYLNVEKNVLNPVRSSELPDTKYFPCPYCLGHYSKKLLHKHVKICLSKPASVINPGRNCLSKSQSMVASIASKNNEFLRKSRIQKEVLDIMRADNISAVAKRDPLICLYGETLICKHKREQIASLISTKMRQMARMLIVIRAIVKGDIGLFDVLQPEMFQTLLAAAKTISGYDADLKEFKAPSLALHMGTNLKTICDIAIKLVLEGRQIPNIKWTDKMEKKSQIKDLKKLIEGHWCSELSSLALKNLKERQWENPKQLPLSDDILAFQKYLDSLSLDSYEKLKDRKDIKKNYKILIECLLVQTILFNRKRVGDVQFLKVETYVKNYEHLDQEAFTENLTTVEKILCTSFKRVVTGGKGSKPVPILFSRRTQKYMDLLLQIRNTCDLIPKTNPYMFAAPGSKKWMSGASVIRRLASKCGAKYPQLLSSTRFRKHIATTMQLMTMEPQEMEQLATFMGHTEKTHAEFYRLPQDIYQTAKVAKVLMLLEKGKGKEFKGKSLSEIQIEDDSYISESSEDENTQEAFTSFMSETHNMSNSTATNGNVNSASEDGGKGSFSNAEPQTFDMSEITTESNENMNAVLGGKEDNFSEAGNPDSEDSREPNFSEARKNKSKKLDIKFRADRNKKHPGRGKWPNDEKKLVLSYFKKHVEKRIPPKKHECEQFIAQNRPNITVTDWVKVKTLVYNSYRMT